MPNVYESILCGAEGAINGETELCLQRGDNSGVGKPYGENDSQIMIELINKISMKYDGDNNTV